MRYTPKKNGTAKMISLACVLLGCILIATVFLDVPYKAVYEIIALLFFVLSFELLFRYVFTEFTYIIDEEGNFIREKISENATPRQKELFEQYLKELEYARSRTITLKK